MPKWVQTQTPQKALNHEKSDESALDAALARTQSSESVIPMTAPGPKRREGGAVQERPIACARGGARRSACVDTVTKRILYIAVRCPEQQFQVARHRTTIRSETHFGKDALPQESFDLSSFAKKDSSYVSQLFILSLARTVGGVGTETVNRGGLEDNAPVIEHVLLASKRSHWSAREERIHGLRILRPRDLKEEKKPRSAAAVRGLTAELAVVLRVAAVAVAFAVAADASTVFAAQRPWCTLCSPLRRPTCLMATLLWKNLFALCHHVR